MIGEPGNGERLELKAALRQALRATRPEDADPAYAKAKRAAAISSFFAVEEMAGILPEGSDGSLSRLASDCVAVVRGGRRLWILRGSKRRDVHATWRLSPDGAREAINTLRVGEVDVLATMIERYVVGDAVPLREQNLMELSATEQIAAWLGGVVPGVPRRVAVQSEIERRDLVRPFLELAGPSIHFAGRAAEMDRLREHVGVLDRRVPVDAWIRRFTELLGSRRKVLPVVGVGGAGKSTLIAKFVLDHVLFDDPRQIPFAYLDFDRPSLDAGDPIGLLLECVRQLRAQYPSLRDALSALSEAWRAESGQEGAYDDGAGSAKAWTARRIPAFAAQLADALKPVVDNQTPFLVVFDTFEEALYGGVTEPARWMIEALEDVFPSLRVVVAGRVEPPPEFGVEKVLSLEAFDEPSAIEFVVARGVDRAGAAALIRQVHRTPLVLRLAADLAVKEGLGKDGLTGLRTRGLVFRITDGAMASQLHTRILAHIHDDEVRKLAHPGLILRKVTPDIIQRILAQVCGLEVPTREHAEELYAKLRREVTLVTERDGALLHRRDVRSFTLGAMAKEGHVEAETLHRLAIAYYEGRDGDIGDRSEELYHRLSLGQPGDLIEARWTAGVERLLLPSIDELPPRSRAYLARHLGRMPDDEAAWVASAEDGAALALRLMRDALATGQPSRTLELVDAGIAASRFDAEIRWVQGQALRQRVRWREAATAFAHALEGIGGAWRVEACAASAELSFDLGELDTASNRAREVLATCGRGGTRAGLSALTILAAIDRLSTGRDGRRSSSALLEASREADRDGTLTASQARRIAELIGDVEPEAVAIACRRKYPSAWTGEDLAILAQALARWDERTSHEMGVAPGFLARQSGAGQEDPNLAWSLHVANAPHDRPAGIVATLFERTQMSGSEAAAFARILGRHAPEWIEPATTSIVETYRNDLSTFGSITGHAEADGDFEEMVRAYASAADAAGMLLEALLPLAKDPRGGVADVARALARWRKAASGSQSAKPAVEMPARGADRLKGTPLELVTAFFQLDVDRRLGLARELGLVGPDDLKVTTSEVSRLVLRRAAERGILSEVERLLARTDVI